MDLAKDPGCDGAWAKGVRLVVNDYLDRFGSWREQLRTTALHCEPLWHDSLCRERVLRSLTDRRVCDDGGASFYYGVRKRLEIGGVSLLVDGDEIESENRKKFEWRSWRVESRAKSIGCLFQTSTFKLQTSSGFPLQT